MTAIRIRLGVVLLISCAAAAVSYQMAGRVAADGKGRKNERSRVTLSHDLPSLNGDKLTVTVVEVNCGPGEFSKPHSHPCPVIGYVLEGTLRMQVKGESERIYKAGESFYEAPNGVHLVSANASDTERARFLAYFVCDHHARLSVDAPGNKPEGEK